MDRQFHCLCFPPKETKIKRDVSRVHLHEDLRSLAANRLWIDSDSHEMRSTTSLNSGKEFSTTLWESLFWEESRVKESFRWSNFDYKGSKESFDWYSCLYPLNVRCWSELYIFSRSLHGLCQRWTVWLMRSMITHQFLSMKFKEYNVMWIVHPCKKEWGCMRCLHSDTMIP